jgi:hypothetical protein
MHTLLSLRPYVLATCMHMVLLLLRNNNNNHIMVEASINDAIICGLPEGAGQSSTQWTLLNSSFCTVPATITNIWPTWPPTPTNTTESFHLIILPGLTIDYDGLLAKPSVESLLYLAALDIYPGAGLTFQSSGSVTSSLQVGIANISGALNIPYNSGMLGDSQLIVEQSLTINPGGSVIVAQLEVPAPPLLTIINSMSTICMSFFICARSRSLIYSHHCYYHVHRWEIGDYV